MENTYKELTEMLERNLKAIVKKGDISKEDLPYVKEATSSLKNINMITDHMRQNQNGYSEGMMNYSGYNPNISPVTGNNISHGSRIMHGYNRMYYDNPNNYSGHSIKDRLIACIEPMYDTAHSEYERQFIANTINRIQNEN